MSNVGKKAHDFLVNSARKSLMLKNNVRDTVADIPVIAGEQFITSGPRFLDAINDYVYKPVSSNIKSLVTGKDYEKKDNAIDKIANQARYNKKNFYKNYKFQQEQNKKYGELLGNRIEDAALLGLGALKYGPVVAKYGTNAASYISRVAPRVESVTDVIKSTKGAVSSIAKNEKPVTNSLIDKAKILIPKMLSRDKQIKSSSDKVKALNASLRKHKVNLTVEEQAKISEHINVLKSNLRILRKNKGIKLYNEMKKSRKVDAELLKIANPDGAIKSGIKATAKLGAITTAVGLGGLGIKDMLTSNKETPEDNADIESKYTVPNPFTEGSTETRNFDTSEKETKSAETVTNKSTPEGKPKQKESEKYLESVGVKVKKSNVSAPVFKVYRKSGEPVQVYLVGSTLQAKGSDGSMVVLSTGVTKGNLRHKYTMISNTPFNN